MAESGYYSKRPRPQHRDFLEQRLLERRTVDSVEFLNDFTMIIERDGKSTIRAHLTNLYEIGVADVEEILGEAPETNCIVSTMNYNHYSIAAKKLAASRNVGLFRSTELLGAIYYDNEKFVNYLPPSERE